jgi:hypothetical protein
MKIAGWLPFLISSGTPSQPADCHEEPQNHSCCLAHSFPTAKKARLVPKKGAKAKMATAVNDTVASAQGMAARPHTSVERIFFMDIHSSFQGIS